MKKKSGHSNGTGSKRKLAAIERREQAQKAALATLGINPRNLEREPKFSAILEDKSLGGLKQVLEAMRLSPDPTITKFIERYDRLSKSFKDLVPWEAVAMLAEVNGRELLGSIILALRAYSAMEVKITALTAHAKVTHATVEAALYPEGHRDRQMIHQALGFLAPPKGQTINVNFPGMSDVPETSVNAEIAPEDIDMNTMFPDLTTTQRKMLPE